jgi:multicomponent Na+:H+ antiporter subunit C
MTLLLSLVIGVCFGGGVYLLLRGPLFQSVLGLGLMGHAINLTIFTLGGVKDLNPPIMELGESALPTTAIDPFPQALILTAIVIGFAMQAFLALLVRRIYLNGAQDLMGPSRGSEQ